jgi:hypothetical protein
MKIIRLSVLYFLGGLSLIAGCSMDKFGVGDITGASAGREVDSTEFMTNLTDGTKAYLGALAAFLQASGKPSYATQLTKFSAGAPERPWDASTFEAAFAKATDAPVTSETEIRAPKDIAYAHITGAFVLSSYAGYLYKEALQDAREVARQPLQVPQDTSSAALKAAQILPSYIKTTGLITKKSSEYMLENGIARPSIEEATLIIQENVGFVETEVIDRLFK